MVYGFIQSVRHSLKYRGGWRGLLQHMYTNGDYPFKVGTYMGSDAHGNRYYENRIDYPLGQHRWVEPADIHNFDSTQVPPEWHGWMLHMNDSTPETEKEFIEKLSKRIQPEAPSNAPYTNNVGYQNKVFNFNGMHNQSQIRSRGYGIGNPVVGLPPHVGESFYTQPGSPYNEHFIRKFKYQGDLDEAKGGGRPYKNQKWKERLMTEAEKKAQLEAAKVDIPKTLTSRERAILARGGSLTARN